MQPQTGRIRLWILKLLGYKPPPLDDRWRLPRGLRDRLGENRPLPEMTAEERILAAKYSD